MNPFRVSIACLHLAIGLCCAQESFINFETAPVHPIELSPDRARLVVCNLADGRLEVFDVTSGNLSPLGSISVGIDPVSVRFRTSTEAWVVNHISDSISVVDLITMAVTATIQTLDTPSDVVFAGGRAFVSCALPNTVQVFYASSRQLVTNLVVEAERPKALAVSPDGSKVYAAIFESGNATTIIGPRFRNLLFIDNPVSRTNGPYAGQNPPPNFGTTFNPPLNPALGANLPPKTGMIVRKNSAGRWMDDNQHDWTEFVSGTNAHLTQRFPGWDLPDRDLAIIDTTSLSVMYATGLMNICMAIGVNPASGRVAVVGTDAINEVRFEPNLNGIFAQVKIALMNAEGVLVQDLNPTLNEANREKSIGDPRAIIWTADGTRGYVAGMGSRNVVLIDENGSRAGEPIEVGEGPSGLAMDEARQRLYVFNRFSSSVSVIDTVSGTVVSALPLFDPTPVNVSAGRRHLYDTRRTSAFGQVSCASCHVDARMDRLAWDLGNPAGEILSAVVNHQGTFVTNKFHPMKGVMVTQTLQDIIGHEPFHWRGDRPDIESFNVTFTNLQGAARGLTDKEMRELRDVLASIRFPPNPHRQIDNSLSTNISLSGHVALGDGELSAGTPLPNGNAAAGWAAFNKQGNFCVTCHTAPTGLGLDKGALGPNGGHHFPLAFRLEESLRSKISQFRNMQDKIGMDTRRSGFGFGHDGSIDSLTRFLNGVRVVPDQEVADLIAFLLSTSDSPPAALGRQFTTRESVEAVLQLDGLDVIAKRRERGWVYDRSRQVFQSDRQGETASLGELIALGEVTFTVVARGSGVRLGIDRDSDGLLDGDDPSPADQPSRVRIVSAGTEFPVGSDLLLEAQFAAVPSPISGFMWQKDGQSLAAQTNESLLVDQPGEYVAVLSTAFQTFTSPPVRIREVPLIVKVAPASQAVRVGSNATFTAEIRGLGPVTYQWQFKDEIIGTQPSLTVTSVQLGNEGEYRLIAANTYGAVTSAPVHLGVLINPSVVVKPLDQKALVGDDATFSFMISGHPPPFGYFLRRSSNILASLVTDERTGFLSLSNVQTGHAGTYRVVVTNAANPSGLIMDPVSLTVLADSDTDGLPDEWEAQYASDARGDPDLDRHTNREEYLAGTDPLNPQSVLKLRLANLSVLEFEAISKKTYSVQWHSSLNDQPWMKLADVIAMPTNRTVVITNTGAGFYRLVTPRMP
jgi:YVTN family beta-propeller protein